MNIVIVANFCRDFSKTDNGRFMYLCKELSKEHDVEIITSDFQHSAKVHKEPLTHNWPFKITFIHEPGYKKNISVRRFLSHWVWGRNVAKYLASRNKPDVIYCAVPSLTAPMLVGKYCNRNNIKFVIDIQDLWPEAFRMVLHIPIASEIVFAPFQRRANAIYNMADDIVAVSQTYVNRALSVSSKCNTGHAVFLGTNLETYDRYSRNNNVASKPNDELWIGYCGSMGDSYDLNCVIDALALITKPPKLIAMGDGQRRKSFEQHAKEKGVNAVFVGRLPYEEMCGLLSSCDMVINPIVGKSAASIINKHADYAAAGLPIINTQESEEYKELVDAYEMGFNCKNGDSEEVCNAIKKLIGSIDLRSQMGNNARKCAEEKFDRKKSYKEIISCVTSK